MNFLSYIADARNTIISNKLRSGLSSLGIIIGVTSVVVLMSLGAGTQAKLLENIGSMVSNTITISKSDTTTRRRTSTTSSSTNSFGGGGVVFQATTTSGSSSNIKKNLPLNYDTLSFLETTFPTLSGQIAYTKSTRLSVGWSTESVSSATVTGIPQNYFGLSKQNIQYGTNFSTEDIANNNFYAIVNYGAISALFDGESPLGQTIKVGDKHFTVVGVLEETSMEKAASTQSVSVYIPITTMMDRVVVSKEFDSFTVYLGDEEDNESWKNILEYSLMRKVSATSTSQLGFTVSSTASFIEQLQSTMAMFSYFLGAIGGISLLVGGIGVMNIMIVSVTERTREIGIRKAIGALRKDIIMQFLTESIVITLLGGLIAIGLSYGIAFLVNTFLAASELSLEITSSILSLALGLTMATGILFGILPANKAAKLKPIDALRFE